MTAALVLGPMTPSTTSDGCPYPSALSARWTSWFVMVDAGATGTAAVSGGVGGLGGADTSPGMSDAIQPLTSFAKVVRFGSVVLLTTRNFQSRPLCISCTSVPSGLERSAG